MIHALYLDSENSVGVYLDDENYDGFYQHNFRGKPMKDHWKPPPYIIESPKAKLKDFLAGTLMAPAVSERAKKALEPLIAPYVEFLPAITIRNVNYFDLNVIKLVDCVDLENSEISYAPGNSGKIMSIYQFSFIEDKIENVPIFKVPQDPGLIFVNDDFVKVVLDNKLTGVGVQDPSKRTIMKPPVSTCEGLPVKVTKEKRKKSDSIDEILEDKAEENLSYYEGPGLQLCFNILEKLQGEKYKTSYQQKEIDMLKQVPKKLGYYYLLYRFDGLRGNGGMQAIVFDKEIEENKILLEKTAEAMDYYGFREKAKLIKELIPIGYEAQKQSDELLARDAGDEEFEPIWGKIDAFDPRYDSADEGRNMYQAILEDLKKNPKVARADNLREEINDKIF